MAKVFISKEDKILEILNYIRKKCKSPIIMNNTIDKIFLNPQKISEYVKYIYETYNTLDVDFWFTFIDYIIKIQFSYCDDALIMKLVEYFQKNINGFVELELSDNIKSKSYPNIKFQNIMQILLFLPYTPDILGYYIDISIFIEDNKKMIDFIEEYSEINDHLYNFKEDFLNYFR